MKDAMKLNTVYIAREFEIFHTKKDKFMTAEGKKMRGYGHTNLSMDSCSM